jgi:hypothetical protein
MASTAHPNLCRRLRLAVAGAAVAIALTAATAAASPPAPMQVQAAGPAQQGADPDRRAGTPPPGFLLDRGQLTTFSVPGAQATIPYGINDRGQILLPAPGAFTKGRGCASAAEVAWRRRCPSAP